VATKQLTFKTIGGEVVTTARRGKHYIEPRGYAYHPGTGPQGETCGSCRFDERYRRWHKCGHEAARHKQTGGRGSDILVSAAACKYWETVPKSEPLSGGQND
jgi:hypothetical protein